MKNLFLYTFLITFITTTSFASNDWGATGHRTVGKIADQYLKGSTKRKLKKLLNRESLAFTSTFADEIKSDKRYSKFFTWHFINMPFDTKYEESQKNPNGDLVSGINYCVKVIQDKNASKSDKSFYLKFLIHLIGDLHQPMHIGLAEDRGGNDIKLQWKSKDSNLHKVWDTEMIESYNMSYSELANNIGYFSKDEIKKLRKGNVVDWVNETQELSKKVYASVKNGDNIGYKYSYDYFDTVRRQLHIAGIRLAHILNEIL